MYMTEDAMRKNEWFFSRPIGPKRLPVRGSGNVAMTAILALQALLVVVSNRNLPAFMILWSKAKGGGFRTRRVHEEAVWCGRVDSQSTCIAVQAKKDNK